MVHRAHSRQGQTVPHQVPTPCHCLPLHTGLLAPLVSFVARAHAPTLPITFVGAAWRAAETAASLPLPLCAFLPACSACCGSCLLPPGPPSGPRLPRQHYPTWRRVPPPCPPHTCLPPALAALPQLPQGTTYDFHTRRTDTGARTPTSFLPLPLGQDCASTARHTFCCSPPEQVTGATLLHSAWFSSRTCPYPPHRPQHHTTTYPTFLLVLWPLRGLATFLTHPLYRQPSATIHLLPALTRSAATFHCCADAPTLLLPPAEDMRFAAGIPITCRHLPFLRLRFPRLPRILHRQHFLRRQRFRCLPARGAWTRGSRPIAPCDRQWTRIYAH